MQPQPTATSETESSTRRRVIGFFMFPVALFPFLALCTYNWHAVSDLCIPTAPRTSNLIGAAGDWFAYLGYQFIGLGIWSVPVLCAYIGIRLVLGKTFHPGRRTLGVTLLVVSLTCLLQVAGTPGTINVMQGNQPVLYVCAGSHFCGTAHQDTHLSGTDFGKQLLLFHFRIRVMNKGNLLCRNAPVNQLLTDVFIYAEFIFRLLRNQSGFLACTWNLHTVDESRLRFRCHFCRFFRAALGR